MKFALKRIDDHDQAQPETGVLTQLYQGSRAPVHPHIADVYSGFQFEGSTYLICEPADSALTKFLRASSKGPWPLHLNRQWLLSQFRGLAQAVEFVHCGSPAQSIFHQDIRVDNIFVFTDSETNERRFKINDWDRAHIKPTSSHKSPAKCNPSDKSPGLKKSGNSPSPSHDISSLGCVFFELLIWYTEGWEALKKFCNNSEDEYLQELRIYHYAYHESELLEPV
jgi:serine/threonine protein kinase